MAGETYKILDLDIDYNKLIASTAKGKQAVTDMKEALAKMRVEGKANTEEFVKLQGELKAQENQVRINVKMISDFTQAATGQNATIEQQRKALSVVSVEWSRLTADEQANTVQGQKLSAQKLQLTEDLKKLESATGDNRRNVGNYTGSILEAAKGMGIFGGSFGNAITKLTETKDALVIVKQSLFATQAGATGFAGAMNVVKVALASTGIGLIIIAIGVLIAGLSQIDPVVDKVEQVFAGFKAATDFLVTSFVRFVEGIKSVGDLLGKLGAIISNPTQAYKEFTSSMLEAAQAAATLKAAQQELADSQSAQEVLTARANQQVKELILQSKNRSTSEVERQALLKKAADIDEADFQRRTKLANMEIKVAETSARLKGQLSDAEIKKLREVGVVYAIELQNRGLIGQAEVDALKKATLQKIAILDESTVRQEKIQNQSDALEEKRIAKAEAYRKKLEEDEKKREAAAQKKNELIIKEMEQQLRLQQALSERNKVDIVNDDTFQKEELRLANAFIAEKELLEKKYETEKNLSKGSKDELLEIETRHKADLAELNNKYNDITEANLKTLSEKAQAFFDAELENFKKVQQDKIDAANEANDLLTARREEDRLRIATDYENELEIRRLNGENTLNLRLEQLDRERSIELEAAEKSGADRNKIYQKYELAKAAIAKEVQRAQLGSLADGLGQISELLGKNTAAGKAAGIAQATINTYLGVSQVLAAPPSGPEPLNTITKAIAIATTIGTGIANVANIVKVPTKFERGGFAAGITGGNLHASGGTKYYGEDGHVVELEKDENWYVLNRGASRAINELSALNQHYGGVGFSNAVTTGFHADGGMVSRSLEIPDISLQIAKGVSEGIKDFQPVVDVKDIITGVNSRVSLVDGANI